jgi:drug/metabolite transporter (DMT)-like permease
VSVRANNIKGGIVMIVAVGSLSLLDAGMKVLSTSYSPFQVAAIRAMASLPFILTWVAFTTGFRPLARARFSLHGFRALIGILMLAGFVYGMRRLPLSEAYSIFFVAPLLITAFAVPMLGERVGWQRWLAILIGLGGVLIVLRPEGSGMITGAGLAVLLAAVGYALSAITVRILGRTDTTQSMVFWLMFMIAIGAGLIALPSWKPIQSQHWIVIAGIGITGMVGQWAITEAFRIGEASFIAPFEYTALAWGTMLDWLLWRTVPGGRIFVGAAIIIASGIYMMRRERAEWKAEQAVAPLA